MKPLCIDLFCGLGGWAEGFLAQGYDVVGFDNHRHEYWAPEAMPEAGDGLKNTKPAEKRGWTAGCAITLGMEGASKRERTQLLRYPGQLVIQDVLTLHGSQFRNAAVIVCSPPCQAYSYMAMPWSLAKAKAAAIRADETGVKRAELTALFDACFRIQREACEAANTRKYDGPCRAFASCCRTPEIMGHFGFPVCLPCYRYGVNLYGLPKDEAIRAGYRYIPMIVENVKGAQPWVGRAPWNFGSFYLWGDVPALMPRTDAAGTKCGGDWFNASQPSISRLYSSGSPQRKMASAQIAKIPFALSEHIARVFHPGNVVDLNTKQAVSF